MTNARRAALVVLLTLTAAADLAAEPSTEKMVAILDEIATKTDPRSAPFLNTGRLEIIRTVPEPSDPNQLGTYLFILGNESVLAGESLAAVEAFARLRELADDGKITLNDAARRELGKRTALAYLRLGEQENCVDHHNIDRCLLPIRGSGVHSRQRGSRGAIAAYEEVLREDPADLESRWLLNLAYMTLGEHPAKVPPELLIPAAAFASEHPLQRFPDIAAKLGLDVFGLAGGSIVDDFDRDGLLDVVASSWGLRDQIRFFRNLGDGSFADRTEAAGLTGIIGGLNISHADVDNDGWLDILVLRGAWFGDAGRQPNSLLRNDGLDAAGRLTFSDITEEAGLLSFQPTQVGVWADYDNDGWADLFVGNETTAGSQRYAAELFHNNGRGPDGRVTFSEVAAASGIDIAVPIKGAAWGDIDNDGWADLYVSDNNGPNLLFHNRDAGDGRRSFVEIGEAAGVRRPLKSFPTWFWDYDNDGWEDILVLAFAGDLNHLAADYLGLPVDPEMYSRLYRNNGPRPGQGPTFTDVTHLGLERVLVTMGANFGDLDNDGWLDIYAATGNTQMEILMPNRMFRNDSGRRFQDVTSAGGFGHLQKGHGIAFGDLDHDGDQDIYAVMGGAHSGDGFVNALFENPGNDNHWISLELVGVESNRAAIGARLELRVITPDGPRRLFRTVGEGGSFGANTLRQEIGLGNASAIEALEIRWPGSAEPQRVEGLEIDGFYRVRQGAEAERLVRRPFVLGPAATVTDDRHHDH